MTLNISFCAVFSMQLVKMLCSRGKIDIEIKALAMGS